MNMALHGSATFGRLTSALPSSDSIEWKGRRSRELCERTQTSSFCSTATTSERSSACVSSAENLRSSAKKMAQEVCISVAHHGKEPSSSFWGSDNGDDRFHRNYYSEKSMRASQVPRSMPLVEARLFGPSNFNANKLRVLLLGKHDHDTPLRHPRIYTLTHSDITAKITLAVAREINKAQVVGWYSKLQRDEVVAEWRKAQGEVSLHVHCHISGTNFLHRLIANLRFQIFQKELPLVLEAFMHGDRDLFEKHPELQNAPVWVYFHSNVEEFNRVECWGPLVDATKSDKIATEDGRTILCSYQSHPLLWGSIVAMRLGHPFCHQCCFNEGSHAIERGMLLEQLDATDAVQKTSEEIGQQFPSAPVCLVPCDCCSRHPAVIPVPESLNKLLLQSQQLTMPNSTQGRTLQNPRDYRHSD